MSVIETSIKVSSPEFAENRETMTGRIAELRRTFERIRDGGGAKARERHAARGKMLARARIDALIDPLSPFLEIGRLAAHGMYDDQVACAGVVAGIGRAHGRLCMVVANDATVKGGVYFPMTVKKHLRAQEIAAQNRLPCIYLVDWVGLICQRRTRFFPTATTLDASSIIRQ